MTRSQLPSFVVVICANQVLRGLHSGPWHSSWNSIRMNGKHCILPSTRLIRPMCKHLPLNPRSSSHNLTISASHTYPRVIRPMRKQVRLNTRSSSHNLTISAIHTSLCFVFGIVRLVHLGRAFHNFLWVHPQLNIFNCNSPSPLSDLPIAHHSLALHFVKLRVAFTPGTLETPRECGWILAWYTDSWIDARVDRFLPFLVEFV